MVPLVRSGVNKSRSVARARANVGRTKGANMKVPQRGGWRF